MHLRYFIVSIGISRALAPNGSIKIPVAVLIDSIGGINDDTDLIEATFVRIDQLNHENSSLIHNDATIVPTLYNYAQNNELLITDTLDIISKKEIFIIGTGWSSYTIIASLISQNSHIPICDGGSTNPSNSKLTVDLGRKDLYPNFFRTIPNDNAGSLAMAKYIHAQGWGKVATINTDEDYGNGAISSFLNYAADFNITILSRQLIETNMDEVGANQVAQQILSSEARIIVYFGMPANYETLVKVAANVGVYGNGYFWIGSDALQQLAISPDVIGTTFLFPQERQAGPVADAFDAYWNMNRMNVNNPAANISSINSTGPYGYFEASCVDLMALGFDSLVKANGNNATKLAIGELNSQMAVPSSFSFPNFKTTTGKVVLDSNGERDGNYAVFNYQSNLSRIMVDQLDDNEIVSVAPYVYPGGTTVKPTDTLDPTTVADYISISGDYLGILILFIFSVGIICNIVAAAGTIYYRNSSAIKASDYYTSLMMQFILFICWFDLLTMIGKPTKASCILDSLIIPVTFTGYYGLMYIKTLRIFTIFMKPVEGFKLQHYAVVLIGLAFCIPTVFIVSIWDFVHYPSPIAATVVKGTYAWTCCSQSLDFQQGIVFSLVIYSGLVLLLNLFMAFKSRNIPSKYNETNTIAYSIYNTVIVALFGSSILLTPGLGFRLKIVVKLLSVSYLILFNLLAVFLLKVYTALKEENDNRANPKKLSTKGSTDGVHRSSRSKKEDRVGKDHIVLIRKSGIFNDWKSRAMISESRDCVSFLSFTKISLEDPTGSVDANGECWFRKYIKEFKFYCPSECQRKYVVNAATYEVQYQDAETAQHWDEFFKNWTMTKKSSLMNRSVITSSSVEIE